MSLPAMTLAAGLRRRTRDVGVRVLRNRLCSLGAKRTPRSFPCRLSNTSSTSSSSAFRCRAFGRRRSPPPSGQPPTVPTSTTPPTTKGGTTAAGSSSSSKANPLKEWIEAAKAKGREQRKSANKWLDEHKEFKMKVDVAVDMLKPIQEKFDEAWLALPVPIRRFAPTVCAGAFGVYVGGAGPRRRLRQLEKQSYLGYYGGGGGGGGGGGDGGAFTAAAQAQASAIAAIQAAAAAATCAAALSNAQVAQNKKDSDE